MAEANLNYQTIKTTHAAREADDQRTENRKKNLIILILHWLADEGYIESARQLEHETNLDVNKYDVCDNVDLSTILQEYESYFHVKFNRYPKLTKKNGPTTAAFMSKISAKMSSAPSSSNRRPHVPPLPRVANTGTENPASPSNRIPSAGDALRRVSSLGKSNQPNVERINAYSTPLVSLQRQSSTQQPGINSNNNYSTNSADDMNLSFMKVSSVKTTTTSSSSNEQQQNGQKKKSSNPMNDDRSGLNNTIRAHLSDTVDPSDRLLKPLGGYNGYTSEWRELAEVISRDIYLHDPSVRWDSIIGLDAAKRTIKEAVIYPIRYPQLFTGILSPWKALLLYGPPGTGKTLLAKAVATECKTTFFNISASSIVSKWRGDSEKLVRVLFELARFHAPSTIFLDELDAIMSQRGGDGNGGSEHEGSRRMKTELLVQLDGLAKTDDLVFLLAASNLPWELDHAMLRRLEKRVLVDLPSKEAREAMFQQLLPPTVIHESNGLILYSDLDYSQLAKHTEGYSGADIKLVCKEAAMNPLRKVFDILETLQDGAELGSCIQLDSITTPDVEKVLSTTKPSARAFKHKYTQWQQEFESI